MRDLLPLPKIIAHADNKLNNLSFGFEQTYEVTKMILTFLKGHIYTASFKSFLIKEKIHLETSHMFRPMELFYDDFEDKHSSHYCPRLLGFITVSKPLLIAIKFSKRILMIIKSLGIASMPTHNLVIIRSMQLALENLMSTFYDGSDQYNQDDSKIQLSLGRNSEVLMHQLLLACHELVRQACQQTNKDLMFFNELFHSLKEYMH